MPELDAERRERLAGVLAEHLPGDYTHLFHDDPGAVDPPVGCRCGWRHERGVSHHAHLADALAPLIAGWLADDTAVCTTCQHRGGDDQPAQHPGCAAALGRIRAGALREAAEEAEALRSFAHGKNPISEAHLIGYGTARRVIVRQLRDRADRIGGAS